MATGDVDIVVVFPPDPQQSVLAGERAVIEVLHDEIDPIQQAAIEFAAQLAIAEVNATVLATLADDVQSELAPASGLGRQLLDASDTILGDPVGTRDLLRQPLDVLDDARRRLGATSSPARTTATPS